MRRQADVRGKSTCCPWILALGISALIWLVILLACGVGKSDGQGGDADDATRDMEALQKQPSSVPLRGLPEATRVRENVTSPSGLTPRGRVRLAKARVIVADLYPDSGMYPWLGTLLREHESYGDEGFAAAWWYSMIYGGANFGLKVGATAPGRCSGPLDVKSTSAEMHEQMRTDTRAHVAHHVAEMWAGWGKGYRGRGLCEYVMYPKRPHDWGGGQFGMTDEKHRGLIGKAYQEGRLPWPNQTRESATFGSMSRGKCSCWCTG